MSWMTRLRTARQISVVMVACDVENCFKSTLSSYQLGVSAGLCEGGGFLSETHDSQFFCLA